MTMHIESPIAVEAIVDGDTDVLQGTGYGVRTEITVEGTPGEKVILDGIWGSIKSAGDLPIWASVTLTWSGREWPWTKMVSKFDIEYQAVHTSGDSLLVSIAAVIYYLLPIVTKFILVLLGVSVVTYLILKTEAVAQWIDEQGPAVGLGLGAGAVLLAGLIMLGDNK